jgi:hypothetical protein
MSAEFSTNGDRITPVFDLALNHRVQATRVDYEPGGTTEWPHQHPYGAFVTGSEAGLQDLLRRGMRSTRRGLRARA